MSLRGGGRLRRPTTKQSRLIWTGLLRRPAAAGLLAMTILIIGFCLGFVRRLTARNDRALSAKLADNNSLIRCQRQGAAHFNAINKNRGRGFHAGGITGF